MIQLQFLNYLLDTRDSSLLLINNITEEFFSDLKDEFNFINDHLQKYGVIPDKMTFHTAFPRFEYTIVHETPDYLIDKLYDDRNARKLAELFNQVRELVSQDKIDEAMKVYLSSSDAVAKAKHVESVDLFKDLSRYDDYLAKVDDFGQYYVKTGFDELDEIIGGWERNEELATIVARSNMGKSWVLLKCAIAAAQQGLRVGVYSGEMSANKVGYRVDTLIGHIPNNALTKGKDYVMNEYKKYLDGLAGQFNAPFKVLTPVSLGGSAGVSALRAFIERENLDILFIDQHSLLEDDRHGRTPVEKASNISKDLKNLQVLKKIPIISVSQQNRSSTENGVGLEHIAQADRIGQDSTIVIFFEQNREEGLLKMHLVKSRDSENGKTLAYRVDLNKGIFTYVPDAEPAPDEETAQRITEEVYEENVFA